MVLGPALAAIIMLLMAFIHGLIGGLYPSAGIWRLIASPFVVWPFVTFYAYFYGFLPASLVGVVIGYFPNYVIQWCAFCLAGAFGAFAMTIVLHSKKPVVPIENFPLLFDPSTSLIAGFLATAILSWVLGRHTLATLSRR
jgi:hypothetical protein